ncbi:MAG: DUF4097 family beta strand repeat-containing protein [Anaerofustis sp.]
MKQPSRTIAIVAAAMIGIGLILGFSGYALSGFNLGSEHGSNSSYDHNIYTYDPSGITDIDVSDIDSNVIVTASGDKQITVDCYENDYYQYRIDNLNGKLTIEKANTKRWFFENLFTAAPSSIPLTITIPSDWMADLSVGNVSGSVSVTDLNAESLSVANTSGSISIEHSAVRNGISASSVSGSITLNDASCGADAKLETTSGSIRTDGLQTGGYLAVRNVSGSIDLNATRASGDISVNSTSGSVSFATLSGNNLSFETVSASINGTLAVNSQDYYITSDSVSGKVSIMGGSVNGTKQLKATSTSGNIDIVFQ